MLTNAKIDIADATLTPDPFATPALVPKERRFRLSDRIAPGTQSSTNRMWFSLSGTTGNTVTFELWAQLESEAVTISQEESEADADRRFFLVTDTALLVTADGSMTALAAADVAKLPSGGKFAIRVVAPTAVTVIPAVLRIMVA